MSNESPDEERRDLAEPEDEDEEDEDEDEGVSVDDARVEATQSAPPPGRTSDAPEDDGGRARRRRIESLLRESLRRAIEKGVEASVETISRADSAIRNVVDDVKLPKDVVGYVFSQIDETKNALVRGVATEVRDFLDKTDLAGELRRALTSLSFEIKTEIRFIPNDAGVMKPKVKARVAPKRRRPEGEARETEGGDDDDA